MVMISGWTRKIPTPMPLTSPTTAAGTQRDERAPSQPKSDTSVAMTYAVIEATTATDRSMPPVSMVSVWQAARIASGIANRIVDRDPARRHDPRLGDLQHETSSAEQQKQRHQRPVADARHAPSASADRSRAAGDAGGHASLRRRVSVRPDHDHDHHDHALDDGREVGLHAKEEQVGADQRRG